MKLLSVRVVVPCDDAVMVEDLKQRIVEHLQELPVHRVMNPDGQDVRIHWSAVEALRMAERTAAPVVRARKKRWEVNHGGTGTLDE